MDQLIHDFLDWVWHQPAISIYVILFIIAWLENIIPPVPGDIVVILAGYLAAEGIVSFFTVLALTTIGSVIGFMTLFALGWFWGDEIKYKKNKFWLFKYVRMKYYVRTKAWMNRWGQGVILANRFLAGTRSVISLTAGMVQTRVDYTIASSLVSSLACNFLLMVCGWIIREKWEIIGRYLDIYGIVVVVVVITFVTMRIYIKRNKKTEKTV
ncbi:MAG: DedA family protein [Balneolales bacterium]